MWVRTQGKMPVTDGRIGKVGGAEPGGLQISSLQISSKGNKFWSKGYLNEQNCVLEEVRKIGKYCQGELGDQGPKRRVWQRKTIDTSCDNWKVRGLDWVERDVFKEQTINDR